MTAPQRTTPTPATTTRPERSSQKVGRKTPLAWLPWALLGLIALLLALTFLVINAVDDDGPEGAGGDRLGQVSGSDGSGVNGSNSSSGGSGTAGASGQGAFAAINQRALVGGGALPAAPVGRTAGAQALAAAPGTAGTVLFAESSADIDRAGSQVIATAAASLRTAGVRSVEVIGHTDQIAGAPVNDNLSQRRADAVAGALRAALPGVQITTSARSQNEPIAGNDTEEGRQLNRRSVIVGRG